MKGMTLAPEETLTAAVEVSLLLLYHNFRPFLANSKKSYTRRSGRTKKGSSNEKRMVKRENRKDKGERLR
jgi:hypothetical protein